MSPKAVRVKLKTRGISPKVIADLIVSALAFALTAGVIDIDPELAAVISKLLGTLAGVIAGPGKVEPVLAEPVVLEGKQL